ncbi:MAG: DNA-3-methyladenine glycosylase 2 family protein [Actinomycetota bacterium]|nr:DNA-3-methyladenine glycosylase 2 family protein [Actinomycetota bacterium]
MIAVQRRWAPGRPVDLFRTLIPLRHGAGDPVVTFAGSSFWWASRTPDGPGTLSIQVAGGEVLAQGWGPGADRLLSAVPQLLGQDDDWSELDVSAHPLLSELLHRLPGLRLPRTERVLDSLVPACLEQRVTGREAFRAWRELSRTYGEPAPGPDGIRLWLPAEPARLLAVPSWDWHRFGVDGQRHRTIRAVAGVAGRLEECIGMDGAVARRRLRSIPGVGEWTAAETTMRALGDPDAVSVGDFHLANRVGWFLTGAPRSTDETMLELLEPWRGQRARVVRLIELSGFSPPKYGPKFNPTDIRKL